MERASTDRRLSGSSEEVLDVYLQIFQMNSYIDSFFDKGCSSTSSVKYRSR